MCFSSLGLLSKTGNRAVMCHSYCAIKLKTGGEKRVRAVPRKYQFIPVAQIKVLCLFSLILHHYLLSEMVLLIDQQGALQRVQQLKRMMELHEVSFRNTAVSWRTLLKNFMVWKPKMRLILYECSIFKTKRKKYWVLWWVPHYPSLLLRKTMPRNSSGLVHMWFGRCFILKGT